MFVHVIVVPVLTVIVVGVIVVSDMAHAIAFEIPRPGGNLTKVLQFFGGNFVSIAVWAAAVPTVVAIGRVAAQRCGVCRRQQPVVGQRSGALPARGRTGMRPAGASPAGDRWARAVCR